VLNGSRYEWIACGAIPKSRITKVMPFDGKELHEFRTSYPVRSLDSMHNWVWDWDQQLWVVDNDEGSRAQDVSRSGNTVCPDARKRKSQVQDADSSDGTTKRTKSSHDSTSEHQVDIGGFRAKCHTCGELDEATTRSIIQEWLAYRAATESSTSALT
jgi:hypothetical protein